MAREWLAPLIWMLCAPPLGAQGEARVVLRAESRLVVVDAVVRDKKGKPVRDLGPGDFELWDNNQEQKIVSASLEDAGGTPDRRRGIYLLLFFDGSTVTPTNMAAIRRDAGRFIDANASPDRYLAVAYFTNALRLAQNFTSSAERAKRAVDAVPALGTAQSLVISPFRPNGGYGASAAEAEYSQGVLLPSLGTLVESMGSIRGRKALVVFAGGARRSANLDAEIAATALACNRANVVTYVMDSGSTLRALADQTGGRMISVGADVGRTLEGIAGEQQEYYSLGFVPPQEEDGTCHTLRVKVKRPGVEVRARTGYCNAKPADALAGKAEGKAVEERAAGAGAGTMAVSMQVPFFYRSAKLARVFAAADLAPTGIRFEKVKGKLHAQLNVVGAAYREGGEAAARFSDTVNLDFDSAKEAAGFSSQPYHYENQFDLGAGRFTFRLAFTASGGGFGKAEMPLAIEPWDSKAPTLSAVAIASAVRKVPDLAGELDDALLEDRRPLRAGSLEVTPSGSNRCSRSRPCQAYIELYNPMPGPVPALQVRILDPRTGEPKLDSGPFALTAYARPDNPVTPVPLTLAVGGLAAGSYRIEVRALNPAGSVAAMRLADLEIE